MSVFKFRSIFLCIAIVGVQECMAWGVTGHRVVAEIAQRHLSARAQKNVKKLCGGQPMAYWANWADFIKSDSNWRYAGPWHYVDLEARLSKTDFIAQLKALKPENLYTRMLYFRTVLQNSAASEEEKQVAIRFLIHLVGDLGQPLHVGRNEDQGGNKIQVTWFGTPSNLHRVWDEQLIDFQQWSYTEYANVLDVADRDLVKTWVNTPIEDWFYESHALSDKIYGQIQPGAKLSYQYNFLFVQDVNTQLLKSGLRLAKILNEVFA